MRSLFSDPNAPDNRPGEYLASLVESWIRFFQVVWMLKMFFMFLFPYAIYQAVRDCMIRGVMVDKVDIRECNAEATPTVPFISDPEKSEFQYLPPKPSNLYLRTNSVWNAEKWLLKQGYKVREISIEGNRRGDYLKSNYLPDIRTFYVKGQYVDGMYDYVHESVVTLSVNYGDDQWHHLNGDEPERLHFNKFEEINPKINFLSTSPRRQTSQYVNWGTLKYKSYSSDGNSLPCDSKGNIIR